MYQNKYEIEFLNTKNSDDAENTKISIDRNGIFRHNYSTFFCMNIYDSHTVISSIKIKLVLKAIIKEFKQIINIFKYAVLQFPYRSPHGQFFAVPVVNYFARYIDAHCSSVLEIISLPLRNIFT